MGNKSGKRIVAFNWDLTWHLSVFDDASMPFLKIFAQILLSLLYL